MLQIEMLEHSVNGDNTQEDENTIFLQYKVKQSFITLSKYCEKYFYFARKLHQYV